MGGITRILALPAIQLRRARGAHRLAKRLLLPSPAALPFIVNAINVTEGLVQDEGGIAGVDVHVFYETGDGPLIDFSSETSLRFMVEGELDLLGKARLKHAHLGERQW